MSNPIKFWYLILILLLQPLICDSQNNALKKLIANAQRNYEVYNYDSVIYFTKLIIQKDPNNTYAYILSEDSKNNIGDYEGALIDVSRAIELDSQNGLLYYDRGIIKENLGYHPVDDIMADYDKAIKMGPQIAQPYYARARLWFVMEEQPNNEKILYNVNLALKYDPNFALAYNLRARIYEEEGEYESAISDYNMALSIVPENLAFLGNRAYCKTLIGNNAGSFNDYKKVVEISTRLLEIYPKDGDLYYHRASARINLRDIDGACSDWHKSLLYGNKLAKEELDRFCR